MFHRWLAVVISAALMMMVGAATCAGAATAPTTGRDHSIISRNIIPSGQYGSLPTPGTLPAIEQQDNGR